MRIKFPIPSTRGEEAASEFSFGLTASKGGTLPAGQGRSGDSFVPPRNGIANPPHVVRYPKSNPDPDTVRPDRKKFPKVRYSDGPAYDPKPPPTPEEHKSKEKDKSKPPKKPPRNEQVDERREINRTEVPCPAPCSEKQREEILHRTPKGEDVVERYYDPANHDVVEFVDHGIRGARGGEEGEERRPYNGGTRREEE